MRTVTIIQRRLTHYRVPFFELLRERLHANKIRLRVLCGPATPEERKKHDGGHLPWAEQLSAQYLLNGRICIQPFHRATHDDDLVIVGHENKMICNLIALTVRRPRRIAFWGHGANFQSTHPEGLKERFKGWSTNRVDWWFAYTDVSVPFIERFGFPRKRITVINNSVDTATLGRMWHEVPAERLESLRRELRLEGSHVGIFIGSLYEEKRIGFMLEAATLIKARVPAFEFLVVGAGPQKEEVERFCAGHPWVRYLGMRQEQAKAEVLALSKVMINPGLVGLGILDAFACSVPMLTTDCGLHSPEIAYISNGENGIISADTLQAYAKAVSDVLQDRALLTRLRVGCAVSAATYTVENMAKHFVDGAMDCLDKPAFDFRKSDA